MATRKNRSRPSWAQTIIASCTLRETHGPIDTPMPARRATRAEHALSAAVQPARQQQQQEQPWWQSSSTQWASYSCWHASSAAGRRREMTRSVQQRSVKAKSRTALLKPLFPVRAPIFLTAARTGAPLHACSACSHHRQRTSSTTCDVLLSSARLYHHRPRIMGTSSHCRCMRGCHCI